MRLRSTLILILLLLGLGAYVYWVEYPKAQQEAERKTLVDFKADDATEVSLAYADRQLTLKKSGDAWRLTAPIDALADPTTVKNLINAIAECEVKKELTDASAERAQYGLDTPLVTITVQLKDRQLPAILVGKNTPVGASTYVERADNKQIVLTSAAFRAGVDKQVKDLRDKTIVSFNDDDVQAVGLHGGETDIELVRTGGAWRLERPASWPADPVAVRSFLSTLRSMRATDFPADAPTDLDPYGLDSPRLTVTLRLGKEQADQQVRLGKPGEKNEFYVQTSGSAAVYTVSDWIFRDLNKAANDFRDQTLLAFDRDSVTAVEVARQDGGRFKLVRGDNKEWSLEGNDGQPNTQAITQFLGDLHGLKGYEVLADHPSDPSEFGLDRPLLSLAVFGENAQRIGTVLLAPRPGDEGRKEYTGMIEGGPTVFLVRDYLVTRLNKQAQDFVAAPTPAGGAPMPAADLEPEPGDEPFGGMHVGDAEGDDH